MKNAQSIVLAYDGVNPLPAPHCYLKPYYLVNSTPPLSHGFQGYQTEPTRFETFPPSMAFAATRTCIFRLTMIMFFEGKELSQPHPNSKNSSSSPNQPSGSPTNPISGQEKNTFLNGEVSRRLPWKKNRSCLPDINIFPIPREIEPTPKYQQLCALRLLPRQVPPDASRKLYRIERFCDVIARSARKALQKISFLLSCG